MQTFLDSNELMQQLFTQAGASIEESFTGTIMTGLVSILPIAIVNKLFAEESRNHLNQLYATKVSRGQFYWTMISLAIIASLVGIFLAAAGLGTTAIAVMKGNTTMELYDFLSAGYNFLPSVLFFIG